MVLGREVGAERLDAAAGAEVVLARVGADGELPRPEAAGVAEAERVAVVERHEHAAVRRALRGVIEQRPRHAQVHEQRHVVLRLPEEVLAAPPEMLDPPSDERVDERRGRQRLAPPGVGDLQRLQRAALDQRRELAADRLDLGKLGHGNRG